MGVTRNNDQITPLPEQQTTRYKYNYNKQKRIKKGGL
jgi:hypothetical protein